LKVSNPQQGARAWLDAMAIPNAILSGALAVMHPDLYAAGREAMVKLGQHASEVGDDEMAEVLSTWSSVYSVLSLMVNRQTPLHRDFNGRNEWLDLLVSFGKYHNATFSLSNLRLVFRYDAGTILAFSGRLLRHGASVADGDRECIAYYMRDNVHAAVDVAPTHWMEYRNIRAAAMA
jgi:hypothetical protein